MTQISRTAQILQKGLRSAWAGALGMVVYLHLLGRVYVSVGISDFFLAPAIAADFASGNGRKWRELRRDTITLWILGLCGSMAVAFLVAWIRLGHLTSWAVVNRGVGLVVLISVYGLFASTPQRHTWFYLRCFVMAGSLVNLLALAAVVVRYRWDIGSVFFFAQSSLRLSGLMHNPNTYGEYLAALLAVQLTAAAFDQSIWNRRWIDQINILALLGASFFTISRGSWLAIFAGALTVPLVASASRCRTSWSGKWLAPATVAGCIGALFLIGQLGGLFPILRQGLPAQASQNSAAIYFSQGPPSFSEFLRIAGDPTGASDRVFIIRTALQLYAASPSTVAFGLGLGLYAELAPSTSLQSSVIIHNSFLWALVELGPLGAICLLGIFSATLRRLWRSLRAAPLPQRAASAAIFAALITVMVWCMSSDGIYQRHLWFLLGLAAAATSSIRSAEGPERSVQECIPATARPTRKEERI